MKRLFYIIPFLIASCGQTSNQDQKQFSIGNIKPTEIPKKPIKDKAITFKEVEGKAVLIGDNIDMLDSGFQQVMNINEGAIVNLKGLSDSLFQKTGDYCDAFYYVKISTDSGDRIIDGRNVYQMSNSKQDTSFQYQNKKFDLKTTSFFGIGVSDDNGLTFCSKYYEPVVLINKEFNNPKLIEIVKNDISNKASWNDDFQYFELMANDGAYDKIQKIEQTENGLILTIKREFQEGWNEFQVRLSLDNDNYKVEYLNYGEIKY